MKNVDNKKVFFYNVYKLNKNFFKLDDRSMRKEILRL